MNPWLEGFWRDVHASLLVYARDQLNAELPPDLHARVDERLSIEADDEKARAYLPDLALPSLGTDRQGRSWARRKGGRGR